MSSGERDGCQPAAIDVDDVGDRVEGEERDRDRQRHVDEADRRIEAELVREGQRLGDEEVEIFEIGENAEIERDAERQRDAAKGPLAPAST